MAERKRRPRKTAAPPRPSWMAGRDYAKLARLYREDVKLTKFRISREHEWPPEDQTARRWTFEGFECAVSRGALSLCGYVAVMPGHPWHGKLINQVKVVIHGGLTFCCKGIAGRWWFGFNTGHEGDWIQMSDRHGKPTIDIPGRIWTVADLSVETQKLATQAAHAMEKKSG